MSNFTIYRASAGSGKTFSLVIEYLSIALNDASGKNYRKILGVTFTNKAAGELKERIIKFLKGVSVHSTDPSYNKVVADKLKERLGIDDIELGIRAKRTLTDILHNYSRLSISTIDKFVHRLIRSFARELKLQGDFEIEMDSKRVFEKVAQRTIDLVGKDAQLTEWIISWLIGRLDDNSGTGDYEAKLARFMEVLSFDEAAPFRVQLLEMTMEHMELASVKLDVLIKKFETELGALGDEAWAVITNAGLTVEDFAGKSRGIAPFFQKIQKRVVFDVSAESNSSIYKAFAEQKLCTGKGHPGVEAVTPELTRIFDQISELAAGDQPVATLAKLLKKELYVLGLARRMEVILKDYLEEKNTLLISDFNKMIAEVVVNEPAPFIYELLGERYDHFLIDEFQDTSILQWQNFLPLVDNSLGKGGKTLIVGDGKQSIYRFRGGEVEQFQQLPGIYQAPNTAIFRQYAETLERNKHTHTIEENFRSTRNVVEFNNKFIGSLNVFLSENNYNIFSDGAQIPMSKEEGYVYVKVFQPNEEEEDDLNQLNIGQLLSDIDRVKANGYTYADCCVLVSKNADGSLVAAELLARGIPIISEDSLTVLFSPKTRLMLGCLQLLSDNTSSFGQLNTIENAVSLHLLHDDVLTLFRAYCSKPPAGKQGQSCHVERLFRDLGIVSSIDILRSKDLYSLTEAIARELGFMDEYDPFVQFFLDQNLSCMQKEGNHLADCVNWWETNHANAKVVMPEGMDAIRILTIHKSKGLEFNSVFLPFIHQGSRATKDVLWIEPGEQFSPLPVGLVPNSKTALKNTGFEDLNLTETEKDKLDEANRMYVALTRAAKNLFVYTSQPYKKSGVSHHFYNWIIGLPDFNVDKHVLEMGTLQQRSEDKEKAEDAFVLDRMISDLDRDKLVIAWQAPRTWDPENTVSEKDHGNLVHALLNHIHCMADLDPTMEKFGRTANTDEKLLDQIYSTLKTIIAQAEQDGWMGKSINARNEMEILSKQGGVAEVIRPDRVVFGKDQTWVIDYKTGSQLPKHREQVLKYIRTLKDINYPNVKGTLIYLETGVSIEVED